MPFPLFKIFSWDFQRTEEHKNLVAYEESMTVLNQFLERSSFAAIFESIVYYSVLPRPNSLFCLLVAM